MAQQMPKKSRWCLPFLYRVGAEDRPYAVEAIHLRVFVCMITQKVVAGLDESLHVDIL